MKRYYKTKISSDTGLKIKSILDRADAFDERVEELRKKYNFGVTWGSTFYFKSVKAVHYENEPDMKDWKKIRELNNAYYPRARCKDKELKKDFDDLRSLRIQRYDLDEAIGNKNYMYMAGFVFDIPGIYIFMMDGDCGYNIPEDCEEITNIEYMKLTENKDE